MKPYVANIALAIVLIIMSAWGYLASDTPSHTAFIPAAFGVIFLLLNAPFKKENKVVAHIIVLLTLLLIVALIMPLRGTLARNDTAGTIRVGLMLAMSLVAMATYIKSFVDARKNRAS